MGEQDSFLAFWDVFVGRLEGRQESSGGGQFRAQLDKAKALARQLAPQLGKVRQHWASLTPVPRVSALRRCLRQTHNPSAGLAFAVACGGS